MRALLADALQDSNDGSEVANVKHGQLQIHVTKVADALIEGLLAGATVVGIVAGAHLLVEQAIGQWHVSIVLAVKILGHHMQVSLLLHMVPAVDSEGDVRYFASDIRLPILLLHHFCGFSAALYLNECPIQSAESCLSREKSCIL